jgi:1,2-phenylacetyl-CoA epoxidase PaaB subunit
MGPRGVRGHTGVSGITLMPVWDVLGKRTEDDGFVVVGGVKAPDVDLALLLARETHFRHKEGVGYAVRRRGEEELHVGTYEPSMLGGVTDRSYRRQEAYTGVGAKLKRVANELASRGLRIEAPRPRVGRAAEH